MNEDILQLVREYFNNLDMEMDNYTNAGISQDHALKRAQAEQKLRGISLTNNDLMIMQEARLPGKDLVELEHRCDTTTAKRYIKEINNSYMRSEQITNS